MKLAPLLAVLGHSCDQDVDISSLSCDSRTVTPGALVVAIPGEHADGTQYIPQAVDRGAAAVVSPVKELDWEGKVAHISGGKIGELTQKLYDTLTGIQWGKLPDTKGWTVPVDPQ